MKSSPQSILTFLNIVFSFFFALFWHSSFLAPYSLQLTAILILALILAHRTIHSSLVQKQLFLATAFITSLILVAETGGLNSPLFFTFYFLLFGTAFLSSIPTVLVLTLLIIIFFSSSLQSLNALIRLISLLLITPLAIIFSQQYLKILEKNGKIAILKKKNQEIRKKLTNQETTSLLWLSINLKNQLLEISDLLSRLRSDIAHLTPSQQQLLKTAHKKINCLLKESQKVKNIIDKETDKISS